MHAKYSAFHRNTEATQLTSAEETLQIVTGPVVVTADFHSRFTVAILNYLFLQIEKKNK